MTVSAVFFFMWRNTVKKYSLKETEKLIRKYREDFNSVVSEKLEITEERAVQITRRFDSAEKEIEYFNSRMREAESLIKKLDATNELIGNTVDRNLRRDEMIMTMNSEIEELKKSVTGAGGTLNDAFMELTKGADELFGKVGVLEKSNTKMMNEFNEFENIIMDIIGRIRALEKSR